MSPLAKWYVPNFNDLNDFSLCMVKSQMMYILMSPPQAQVTEGSNGAI